jgi:hypothetical protein
MSKTSKQLIVKRRDWPVCPATDQKALKEIVDTPRCHRKADGQMRKFGDEVLTVVGRPNFMSCGHHFSHSGA